MLGSCKSGNKLWCHSKSMKMNQFKIIDILFNFLTIKKCHFYKNQKFTF